MALNEKIQNEYNYCIRTKQQAKREKISWLVDFDPGSNESFNMRVRSWLRMNAGGVLNTCKSSEADLRKFSDGRGFDLAADG